MSDPNTRAQGDEPTYRYLTRIAHCPEIQRSGLHHLEAGEPALLPWSQVLLVIAAEIGEPEGVRTIVFDLIAETGAGEWRAHRIDAEPGSEAMERARELSAWLAPDACGPSLKSLATDGIPSRWYPDLTSFEEDAIALLAGGHPRPAR